MADNKQKLNINISGMSCASCSSNIENRISKLDGVYNISVNLLKSNASIEIDNSKISREEIETEIKKLGFSVQKPKQLLSFSNIKDKETSKLEFIKFKIESISDNSLSLSLETKLKSLVGVKSVKLNSLQNTVEIVYDLNTISLADLFIEIKKKGFNAEVYSSDEKSDEKASKKENKKTRQLIVNLIISILIMYVQMAGQMNLKIIDLLNVYKNPVNFILFLFVLSSVVFFLNKNLYISGFKSFFNKMPNMNSLIALSTSVAFLYSVFSSIMILISPARNSGYINYLYFDTAVMIVVLIELGKNLENSSKQKTNEAVRKLMNLAPKTAKLIKDDEVFELPVELLNIGDIIRVNKGEIFPIDGEIIKGASSVDEAIISGESMPIEKSIGDKVIGASINLSDSVDIKVTVHASDTVLSSIIKSVEKAQLTKARISRLSDKVASIFVPIIMIIAILSACLWILAGKDLNFAIKIFTGVLVIACPCSLGLATPTAIIVATGKAAELGILFKSAESIEIAKDIDMIMLDKTGTLTLGKPKVERVYFENENFDSKFDYNDYLALFGSLENSSNHPLAKSIVEYCKEEKVIFSKCDCSKEYSGLGVSGKVYNYNLLAGNKKLMDENNIKIKSTEQFKSAELEIRSIIHFAIDGEYVGFASLSDPLKPDSKEAIDRFKANSIKVAMLTGDNALVASKIAKDLNLDDYAYELLPEEKLEYIERKQSESINVAMVGDGINDAPALTKANVGFAIGAGSDIARQSADVILLKNTLKDVILSIELSRKTIIHIKQNLFWAFFYNLLGVPIAAGLLYAFGGPLLDPMYAAIAMSISSISVVLNSLRIKNFKP